jgi:hypothetical protein
MNPAMAADFSLLAENQYHSGFPAIHSIHEEKSFFGQYAVIRYRVEL